MSEDKSKKKSDLGPRLVTVVVAVPILLYAIFAAPAWAFGLLVLWASATSAWEYANITYGTEHKSGVWFTSALAGAIFAVMYWQPAFFSAAVALGAMFVFLFFLFRYTDQERATHQIGSSVTALVYGAVMFGCVGLLHRDATTEGPFWILLLLCIVWLGDTGAYFSGRALGKHKLYPAVSPNKSVEGAVGGFLVSVGSAIGLNYAFGPLTETEFIGSTLGLTWNELTITQILIIAVPANILAQCGDLAESLIKRAHGVKDSGTIIYGHGGMLDRIDALIFAAPWVYICYSNFL